VGSTKSGSNGPQSVNKAQNDKRRNEPRSRGFTHLSYQELLDRKQKGQCFKCGGCKTHDSTVQFFYGTLVMATSFRVFGEAVL
jgi:hypothetical protein